MPPRRPGGPASRRAPSPPSASPAAAPPAPRVLPRWAPALALLLMAVVAYFPALHGEMLWDDSMHLTSLNQQGWGGLLSIWTDPGYTQQYYPLLYSAFWLEHAIWGNPAVLFGDNTLFYHLANVVEHAGVAILFWTVLRELKVPGAWCAAAIFLLHPVNVESVAWMSEQKNTLSALFFLGALYSYLRFEQAPSRRRYAIALFLFALGLLTKTVTATLPGVILVLGWWQRGSLSYRRDLRPLIPFIALAVIGGATTAWLEVSMVGAHGADFDLSLPTRVMLAGRVVWFYLASLAWPAQLTYFYPRWALDASDPLQWSGLVALVALLVVLWRFRNESRAPLAALLIFIGALFPVLGFLNVFPFRFSYVADHFQYLSCMAMVALAVGVASHFLSRTGRLPRPAILAGVAVLLLALGSMTWRQSRLYGADEATLYRATIERNPTAWEARFSLASALLQRQQFAEAIEQVDEGLKYRPQDALAVSTKASALAGMGRGDEAVATFREAIRLDPTRAELHFDLSTVMYRLQRIPDAIHELQETIRIQPGMSQAHFNLAALLARAGDRAGAITQLQATERLEPEWPEMQEQVAALYNAIGEPGRAAVAAARAQALRAR